MDFHTLSRKQLQALCKKNKIPANMTNVAMADSLAALEKVEGIEEVLNPVDTDTQKCPVEKGVGTPACRTSTRRKPVTEEPESSKVSTRLRRGTRARNDEEIDQENKDLNVPVTPSVTTTRRRGPAASTRRKKEDEKPTDHVPKTPAASNSRVKATSAYSTRKSVRLLEKGLSDMSLMDKEETVSVNVDENSEELISVSQQMEDSEGTENGASSLAISAEVIEKTDESEITSSEKSLSKTSFVNADETESVKVDEISEETTVLPQKIEESEDDVEGMFEQHIVDADETESVKVDEISEEMTALSQKIEESEDDVEGANSQTLLAVTEKTDEVELTSSVKNTEFECQSNYSNSEMPLVSKEAEPQESLEKINGSGSPSKDMNNSSESDVELTKSIAQKINESGSPSKDMNNSSESDVELTKSIAKEVNDANNQSGNGIICQSGNSCDSSEPENNIQHSELMLSSHAENEAVVKMADDSAEIHVSNLDDEVDASMMIEEDKNGASEHSGGMFCDENNKEAVEIAHDVQEEIISAENKAIETDHDNENSDEMFSAENKAVETSCDIQSSGEMVSAEKKVVEVEDNTSPLVHEELDSSDIEESMAYVEKDAVMEVCNEPSSERNKIAQGVADSRSPSVINEANAESETADVSAVTFAPITSEQKTTDVPILFTCQDQSELKDNAAVEVKSVRKMCDEERDKQKENQINDDLNSKSMRQLKKMLKNLSLDNKTNNDKSSNPVKEVEKKRTALQELPENRMTAS